MQLQRNGGVMSMEKRRSFFREKEEKERQVGQNGEKSDA